MAGVPPVWTNTDDVVLVEASFADMRDHSGRGLAGIDRVEDHALGAREEA